RHVGDTRGRTHKRLRVHRGVVQSATPALEPGLLESRCLRTPAGVHPSSINRVSTKPGEAQRISQDVIATDAEIADGINFAAGLGRADVLSNSWNFPPGYDSPAIDNAINSAVCGGRGGLGALVVFSGGNTSTHTLLYPATRANVVAVGAIGRTGTQADYSPNNPTLVAPSAQEGQTDTELCTIGDVVTTDLAGESECHNGPNGDPNYTSTFGGTSAAAPQVAGVAALVLSL